MRFSFPSFAQWRSGVIAAVTRFPWNMLCAATGAACAIISIHAERNEWLLGQCTRLAMTAALGMPLFFSLRMVRERTPQLARWPIEILGAALLAAWFFAQPARPFDAPGIVMVRWLLLLAALHFFAAVSAYVRANERVGFWQFNRRLFLRFCLATLYTGVLTIGLELALLSADKLFELKVGKAYGDLWFVMIALFHPAFFLAGVPRDLVALNQDEEYPRGLKAFTQFALAPLVAVYTAILYAYAAKIIFTWHWPHGWVALPVLLLSGIGILAFLFLYPLRVNEGEKWARWYTTNFPRAMAPLTLLLLLSLRIRISEYGVTEQRYLGVVLGLWIAAWALVFILRKHSGIRWVPTSLAAICLFAAFGPWSAGAVSKLSQRARVKRILTNHGLLVGNRAIQPPERVEISASEFGDLESTLGYLVRTHGGNAIEEIFHSILPQADWRNLKSWTAPATIIAALKLAARPLTPSEAAKKGAAAPMLSFHRKHNAALNIDGFRRAWETYLYGGEELSWQPQTCDDVKIGFDRGVLKLATEEEKIPRGIPLADLTKQLPVVSNQEMPDDKLTVDFEHGARRFRIVFNSLDVRMSVGLHIERADIYLLER